MRKILYVLFFLSAQLTIVRTQAQCYNGDWEAGDFTNWQGWLSYNVNGTPNVAAASPTNINGSVPGITTGRQDIMTNPAAFDPVVGGTVMPTVLEGNNSLRLGSVTSIGRRAQTIAYTFTVTAANAKSSFAYALVQEDPPPQQFHRPEEKPFFKWWISKSDNISASTAFFTRIYSAPTIYADGNNPFFTKHPNYATNRVIYKNWQTVCLPDLTPYIGQKLTIYFHTASCTLGQHFGYVYLDGLCQPNPAVPSFVKPAVPTCPQQLIFDASASKNVTDYYWQVVQVDCNTGAPVAGTNKIKYFYNQPPGATDIMALYRDLGGAFGTGCYLITLGVRSCNSNYVTQTTSIQLNFPVLKTYDFYRCCGAAGQVRLQATANTINGPGTFSWYNEQGQFIGNGTTNLSNGPVPFYDNVLMISNTGNARYRVVYTDRRGCRNEAWMYVVNKPDQLTGYINTDFCFNTCNAGATKMKAEITNYRSSCWPLGIPVYDTYWQLGTSTDLLTYSWSTGETTQYINVHPGITQYTCVISNGCTSTTVSIDLSQYHTLTGALPDFDYPNPNMQNGTMWTRSIIQPGNPNRYLRFRIFGMPLGQAPAYNATSYKLQVFERGGQKVYEEAGPNVPCNGFSNGDIYWDGVYQNTTALAHSGTLAPMGGYYWQLWLYNCDGSTINGHSRYYKGDVDVIY